MPLTPLAKSPQKFAVTPRDCALLIAIPLCRDSFLADLDATGKDFVRSYAGEHRRDTREELWERFAPYADLARSVARRIAELDTHVIEGAKFEDFVRTVPRFAVTTLVAHWRSARFRPEDIVAVANATTAADELNALLDRAAASEILLAGPSLYSELTAEQYAWFRARQEIELRQPGEFRNGAAVEFTDGFRSIAEVVAGVPRDYAGTLDLGVCQSVLLGEEISRHRKHCVVVKAADLTHLDFRLALYHQTIEHLHREPQPYEAAVVQIRKALVTLYGSRKKNDFQ